MLNAVLNYTFMQNALLAGLLASVVCGIIGVVIVEKKLVMLSGGIAHTAYGGVGLGYLLGFEPLFGAFGFAVGAALGIGYIKRRGSSQSDIAIGLFWSLGMALGILFIAFMPGYPPDLSSYLFGSILAVTKADILTMLVLTGIITLVMLVFFNHWKAFLFDEEFGFIVGMRTAVLEYTLLLLTAMTIVVLLRVVGIILVLALLTAPAATAGLLTKKLKNRMGYAVLLGVLYCVAGLWISYSLDMASGAVIVILSVLGYAAVYACRTVYIRLIGKHDLSREPLEEGCCHE